MTPLIIALQVATPTMQGEPPQPGPAAPRAQPGPADPGPPGVAPPTAPPPTAPPPTAPPPTAPPPTAPPSTTPPAGPNWNQPGWRQPPPQPPLPYTGQPAPPDKEREVNWWARLEVGFGTYGFSENSSLLSEMGYAGVKTWVTIDGAYMFNRRIGGGLLVGMNRRSSQPELAPDLNVASYFIAAQVPILLGGNRDWAFYVTPRGGYAAAEVEFDNDLPSDLQHTGTFGGALSFQTFAYHLGATVGFMHTPTGALGAVGRGMDFGGLYFALGGTIDG